MASIETPIPTNYYGKYHYAECHYAEFCNAQCRNAECHNAEFLIFTAATNRTNIHNKTGGTQLKSVYIMRCLWVQRPVL